MALNNRFGHVKNVTLDSKLRSALVTFDSSCAAQKALDFFRNAATSDVVAVRYRSKNALHLPYLSPLAVLLFSPGFLEEEGGQLNGF